MQSNQHRAHIVWSHSGVPRASKFDDAYFCQENGLAESRYVFLQHSDLAQRFKVQQGSFNIFETGFGTGLNFLLCAELFAQSAHPDAWLHYTSVEKYPLSLNDLKQALTLWPQLAELAQCLLQDYPIRSTGRHIITWASKRISLTLEFDDVNSLLPEFHSPVQAWFLDGFAPAKNPDMWSDTLFKQMARISALTTELYPNARISVATFSAAGVVKRGLLGAGFRLQKVAGFGNKRHMLKGDYQQTQGAVVKSYMQAKSWHLPAAQTAIKQVTVIGAGLAGASTAYALALRGYQVRVLDKQGIAQGASGNPMGGLYIKLAVDEDSLHNQFYLAGYAYSLQLLNKLLEPQHWQACGLQQLAYNAAQRKRQQRFLAHTQLPETLVQASEYAHTPTLLFAQGGWVSPRHLSQALLAQKNIQIEVDELLDYRQTNEGFELVTTQGVSHTQALVFAAANDGHAFLADYVLPTKAIRGQISYLDARHTPALTQVLCGSGYLTPAHNGIHCLGATYVINETDCELRDSEHLSNLEILQEFGATWQAQAQLKQVLGGRVGLRCCSADYLPIVGALIEPVSFRQHFAKLSQRTSASVRQPVTYVPRLYVNMGHGSRGLSSALLCGELLARHIHLEPPPVSQKVADALCANRFLLRSLIKKEPAAK